MNYTKSTAAAYDLHALMMTEGYTEVEARRVMVMSDLRQAQAKRKCAAEGHRLEDDSYGGPESGCISLHCLRCGYHYHVTLY